MGCADIVPGVSGGTVALITGIYESLLQAIKSIDRKVIVDFVCFRWADAVSRSHLRFLLILFTGIVMALLTLARVIHYLLDEFGVQTAALFFGLIAASIWFVAGRVRKWQWFHFLSFLAGASFAYFLVGVIPVQTPETWWFIFICGVISICAMILPGLSGAFLLLIMGKYAFLTGAIKNPFDVNNLLIITIFCSGAALGLTSFSRLLSYLLTRFHNVTMALLTGLMAGSLRKIWPWKEMLDSTVIRGKTYILSEKNVLPEHFDQTFWASIVLFVFGIALVFTLERVGSSKSQDHL